MKEEKEIGKKEKIFEKYTEKAEAKELFTAVFYCAVSYLFGCAEMMFGTYPLGIAFMCTVRHHVLFAVFGAFLSSLVCGAPISVGVCGCAAALVFRYGLKYVSSNGKKYGIMTFDDSLVSRICSAASGLFAASCLRIIEGGFTYYDLFAGIFNVFFGMFMVYVYSLACDEENRYTQKYEAGIGAVFFSSVSALCTVELFGLSCGAVASLILPLYTARKGGALRGTVIGFLCGAALDITVCPMFGAAGFVCGLLSGTSPAYSITAGILSSLLCGFYIDGANTVITYLPEAVTVLLLYIPFEKMKLLPSLRLFRDDVAYTYAVSSGDIGKELKSISYKNGLSALSRSLHDISEVMCTLSEKEKRPAVHEICDLCEKEFTVFCKKCSMKKLCFKDGIRGSRHIRNTAAAIYEKGALSTNDLPEKIKTNCYFADKITVSLNIKLAEYTAERLKNNKTEVMAEDYMALSELIAQTVQKNEEENEINTELTEKLRRKMLYKDLFSNNVSVYGTESLTVIACGIDTGKIKKLSEEIRKNFSKVLGVTLAVPSYTLCGDYICAIFKRAVKFTSSVAQLQSAKDGETINGDSIFSFAEGGKLYVCICDGMGSGKCAALTSKTASLFLQKMIHGGCNTDGALKMLNHFIRSKTGECFTTVDLMTLDLMTGKASFTKSGAPPSYIIRDGRIFRIASHTPPVGIMAQLCAERIDFAFQNGDIAVMTSDGVGSSDEHLVWLYNILTYESGADTDELCEKIMSRSKEETRSSDDTTVCAVKISSVI